MANLRTFDLNLLLAFDILMRERNVTRAAECMFVTQSAMSHTLHRLRQQLNDPVSEIFKLVVASVKLFRLLFYSNGLAPVAG